MSASDAVRMERLRRKSTAAPADSSNSTAWHALQRRKEGFLFLEISVCFGEAWPGFFAGRRFGLAWLGLPWSGSQLDAY